MDSTAAGNLRRPARTARHARLVRRSALALVRSIQTGAVALLVVFHAVLFWSHLGSGRLFEPGVALRWSIGVLLLALLVGLRRIGVPVLWGRRALVVWVLVALLHVSAAMPATAGSLTASSPTEAALSLVILPPAAGLVFATGLLLLAALRARAWRLEPARAGVARRSPATRLRSQTLTSRLASRAPPVSRSC